MKKLLLLPCFALAFLSGTKAILGQNTEKTDKKTTQVSVEEEEEGPSMFRFEPDFLDSKEKRRAR